MERTLSTTVEEIEIPGLADPRFMGATFRLAWIHGVDTGSHAHLLDFLFRNESTGEAITAKLPPELLMAFPIGSLFVDARLAADREPLGTTMDLSIVSGERNLIRCLGRTRAGDGILEDEEYQAFDALFGGGNDSAVHYRNKAQKCLSFATEHGLVIIPCTVVAGMYYFTSSSMRIQIFGGKIESLYEKLTRHDNRHWEVFLRNNAANADAANIVRLIDSPFARRCWNQIKYHVDLVMKSRETAIRFGTNPNPYVPLVADLPVTGKIDFKVRALETRSPKDGRRLVLVLCIHEENTPYPFDALTVFRRTPDRKVQVVDVFSPSGRSKKRGKRMTPFPPSRFLAPQHLFSQLPDDPRLGLSGKDLDHQSIEFTPDAGTNALVVPFDEETNLGAPGGGAGGKPDIQPGVVRPEFGDKPEKKAEKPKRPAQSIEDFLRMASVVLHSVWNLTAGLPG